MAIISVIIPAYNAESYILETIKSVQKQTFVDLEIIAIDDGSTDRTLEILKGIDDERLRVFSYANSGVAIARNRGIAQARGEFIAFLDADDLWTPDKLETQLEALSRNSDASVVYSWTSYFHEKNKKVYSGNSVLFQGNVHADLLKWNFLASGSNPLIRREAIEEIGGFDSSFPPCEDWDFYLRLSARYKFAVVPKYQVIYRQSATSATASKFDFIEKQCLAVLERNYERAPKEYQHLKSYSEAWIYQYCTQLYLQNSNNLLDVKRASQKFLKAVKTNPSILTDTYGQSLIKWLVKRFLVLALRK